jgi:hypothetical protein
MIIAIDPGTQQSAWVMMDEHGICSSGIEDNEYLLDRVGCYAQINQDSDYLLIEKIESFGMPVGADVFETVYWTGRFAEAGKHWNIERIPRKDVKMALCGSMRAKDANIRQAIIDRYGGKDNAIGKKKTPGPLYGVKSHIWSALALAITWQIQHTKVTGVSQGVSSTGESGDGGKPPCVGGSRGAITSGGLTL